MHSGKIVFSQIMDFLPMYEFRKCVNRYKGNYRVKSFSCLDQFVCMISKFLKAAVNTTVARGNEPIVWPNTTPQMVPVR